MVEYAKIKRKFYTYGSDIMNLSFKQYLIICPLVFLAGFIDAIAGGGGLISLPAYLISGLPVHNALGTNKLSSSFGSATSTLRYSQMGYIKWKDTVCCIIFAFAGSALGAKCALLISEKIFKMIMLAVIPLTAAVLVFRKNVFDEKEPFSRLKTIILSCLIAFLMGIYDGIYGPGAGTFLLLLLTGLARLPLNEANGTAKAINFSTNIAALAVYIKNGVVLFPLGLLAGLFNLSGSFLGTRFFRKDGIKAVRPVIFAVLIIFFLKIIIEIAE